jgi:hypothetical protein
MEASLHILKPSGHRPFDKDHLFVFVIYGLMLVFLWLPFGLNAVTGGEEWATFSSLDIRGFVVGGARPLINLATAVGHGIHSDSLAGLFLVMCICILGKSIALYGTIHQLIPDRRALAFAAGALLMIAPLENTLYQLTFFNYHVAIFTFVTSVFFFIWYYNDPYWLKLVAMGLMLLPTTLITEGIFPLIMVTPALLFWKEGHLSKRLLRLSMWWYAIPVLALGNLVRITLWATNGGGYQRSLIADDNSIATLVDVTWTLFRSHLWDRWLPTAHLQYASIEPQFVLISFALFILTFITALYLYRHTHTSHPYNLLSLLIAGIISTLVGFSVFLITDLRLVFERTTYFSALGAMLVGATTLYVLSYATLWIRVIFIILALGFIGIVLMPTPLTDVGALYPIGLLCLCACAAMLPYRFRYAMMLACIIGLGGYYTLHIHRNFEGRALHSTFIKVVPEQVPTIAPHTIVILIADARSAPFSGRFDLFRGMLRWLYEEPTLQGYVCLADQGLQSIADTQSVRTHCAFGKGAIELVNATGRLPDISYDRVVVLRFAQDQVLRLWDVPTFTTWVGQSLEGYDPYQRIDLDGVPPRRYFTLFP